MIKRYGSLIAASLLVMLLTAFFVLGGCDNPSTITEAELRELTQPAPNPGPSVTPGEGFLQVQFTKVEGASGYRIYWGTVNNPDAAIGYADVPQPESQLVDYTISGLENGVPYYVWAAALYADGRSKYSESDTGTPRARPAAPPSSLTISSNDGALDLDWSLMADADSYMVYYSETGGIEPPSGTPSIEFTLSPTQNYAVKGYIPGLINSTTYTVWIRAKNPSGESNAYSSATGKPASGGTPGTLGRPTLVYGDARLTVMWDAVKEATGYKVYYSTSNDINGALSTEVLPAGAGRLSGVISGLENNKTYYVWVKAVNGTTESVASQSQTETPHPPPPLNMDNPSQTIGEAAAYFPNEEAGKGDRLSRKQETALADLVADSMFSWAEKYMGKIVNGTTMPPSVDFALVNGGVIEYALQKGAIKVGTVQRLLYSDRMSYITLTGAQIKILFEDRVAKVPHSGGGGGGTGAFGQVSKHVRYTIYYNNNPTGGTLAGTLTLNGQPFNDTQSYTFITNTYLTQGTNDGYPPYLTVGSITHTGKLIAEAVADWIYDQNMVPIEPKTDGRIELVDAPW
jgi:hypothetical protein